MPPKPPPTAKNQPTTNPTTPKLEVKLKQAKLTYEATHPPPPQATKPDINPTNQVATHQTNQQPPSGNQKPTVTTTVTQIKSKLETKPQKNKPTNPPASQPTSTQLSLPNTKPKPTMGVNRVTDIKSFLAKKKEERQKQIDAKKYNLVQKTEDKIRTPSNNLNTSTYSVSTQSERAQGVLRAGTKPNQLNSKR